MTQIDRRIDVPELLNEVGMTIPTGYVINLDNYETISLQAAYANMTATLLEFNLYESNDGNNFTEIVNQRHEVTANGNTTWNFDQTSTRYIQFLATPTGGAVDLVVTMYAKRH